jgi:GNAT superfamily N-acetyltransferase
MTSNVRAAEAAPPIPGLTLRTYRSGDAPRTSELLNRAFEADGVPWRTSAAEQENRLSTPSERFNPGRDMFIVEADGQMVATADTEWIDTTDGLREYRMGGVVDPAWRRRGIGTWLQGVLEGHARELDALYPTDRQRVFGTWATDVEHDRIALVTGFGFTPARYFFEMVRPTLDEIEEPVLPEGTELRPITPDQWKQLWDADVEAFLDHWGGFDSSQENFERWTRDPKWDPSLFVVAWDGDQIAGGVVNEINEAENQAFNRKRGWLASVFVRRPWRRRGLGKAVVLRSLQVFRDRGMTSAGLGVDADNPNGALGLYTGTGFEVAMRSSAYRKPMEETG